MHLIFRTALMLCTMLVFVAQALAADVRSYAVLPFKVNGSSGFTYLEKAIPSMLNSRLYWQGHFQPVADAALAKAGPCGPRFEETIRHLKHAHLRLEIIGRHILRRIDEDAILKGEGLLTPAAEKVGHMGILFGFGDAELMRARVSHDFTQRLHQIFLGKRHRARVRAIMSPSCARKPAPLVGLVSRPSMNAWTRTSTPWAAAISMSAPRWLMWLCTPPSDSNPAKCSRPPVRFTFASSSSSAALEASSPVSIATSMRVIS